MEETTQTSETQTLNSHSHKGLWAVIVLLLILAAAACYGLYAWQHNKLTNAQQSLNDANNKISLLVAQQKTFALPTASNFSPQCKSKDNSDLIVAALTPKPVDNYQAYIESCANDDKTPARVVAFKVKADGTRSFAYGAGTGEPMCISAKIIDAKAAQDISKQT